MVLKYLWIVSCLACLGLRNQFVETIANIPRNAAWTSTPEFHARLGKVQDVSVMVNCANNIFGTSVKLKTQKSQMKNITEPLYIKGQALRTPDLTRVQFYPHPFNQSFFSPQTIEASEESQEHRKKRGVLHLYNMVSCATGCDPLTYMGYGCYCGFSGSGIAVDEIDRCCELHDWCYGDASCPFLEYIVPYFWRCNYNQPICAIEHAEFGGPGSCASKLCECDRVLSECLSRFPCPSSKSFCRSSTLRFLHNVALSIF